MTVMRNIMQRGGKPVALVMQGGGALGAYEWGAVTALCEEGYYPVAVAGVSIGAVNAAAIAGARGGDVIGSLSRLWERLTNPYLLDAMPWFAPFGHPNMYWPNYWPNPSLTAYCGVAPLRSTLEEICDFDRINDIKDEHRTGFAVTAAEVATGALKRFLNKGPDWKEKPDRITADHVLASGALPPGFPMAMVNGKAHWDGGLFDNTPVRPMVDLLEGDQLDHVPIVQINLFPDGGQETPLPTHMGEVLARKMELTFMNRFWDDYATTEYDGLIGLCKYAQMIRNLDNEIPKDAKLRNSNQFKTLLRRRCLGNLHVIRSDRASMTAGLDFSRRGIYERRDKGYAAVKAYRLGEQVVKRRQEDPTLSTARSVPIRTAAE